MTRDSWTGRVALTAFVLLAGVAGLALAADAEKPGKPPTNQDVAQPTADAGVRLFDTGATSAAPLSAEELSQKSHWTQLPEDQVNHDFAGDAVLQNNRLALVLRRGAHGAELYSTAVEGWRKRAVLAPVGQATTDNGKMKLSSARIVENNPGVVTVEAAFQAEGKPLAVAYELKLGQLFVRTEPKEGVRALRVEASCRFAVLPDFFADDIMLDATELPVLARRASQREFPAGDARGERCAARERMDRRE